MVDISERMEGSIVLSRCNKLRKYYRLIDPLMQVLFISSYGEFGTNEPVPYIKSQSESLKKQGIEVIDCYVKDRGLMAYAKLYRDIKILLREHPGITIIHAHFVYTAFIAYLAKSGLKPKLIVSFMGDDLYGGVLNANYEKTFKSRFNILLSKFIQTKMDWIIVKSERMMDYIDEKYKHKTSVIPNGVDFQKFPIREMTACREELQLDLTSKYILFLGKRSENRKNFALLKEAHDLLNTENIKILTPHPISGDMVHLYLNACDVLVLCSKLEGSPNVVKEAIICNCPVVSTDVGDVKERIAGIDGCYITKFDKFDLSEKIARAIRFNNRTSGREKSSYLKAENIARRLIDVYIGVEDTGYNR
jgi:teichuronic acid biosynthesis glycosyltransferase TuaC